LEAIFEMLKQEKVRKSEKAKFDDSIVRMHDQSPFIFLSTPSNDLGANISDVRI
jgi:hypothetical protein